MDTSDRIQSVEKIAARQHWMAVLARSKTPEITEKWNALTSVPDYRFLKPPETGLVMVQARAGGSGAKFNFGEMTMTKCIVELADGTAGHAYVAGSDAAHAEIAAVLDAMLQVPERRKQIEDDVIDPLNESQVRRKQAIRSKTAATRVDFFTLVRGEDE